MATLLFIAGIPASGKPHLGRWLDAERGYLHIDAEVEGELERLGLRAPWNDALTSHDYSDFAATLTSLTRAAVLNWGFPPACLPLVAAVQRAGFSCWWFDADRAAARRQYTSFGHSAADFDTQVAAIQSHQGAIDEPFASNVVEALSASGDRMPPASILNTMRRTG